MPIDLGTRGRNNIAWGPADVYIAEAQTIAAPAAYAAQILEADLATLLADFTYIGTLGPEPYLQTDPVPANVIQSPGVHWQVQHAHKIEGRIILLETDISIVNELVDMAEALTHVDFLFLRSQDPGERVAFLRDVPFTVATERKNSWKDVDRLTIDIAGQVKQLHEAIGQWTIFEDVPS